MATLASLVELLGQGEVYGHIWVSLKRILIGLLLALLMGVPLGLLVGSYRHLEAVTACGISVSAHDIAIVVDACGGDADGRG